jgi:DNA-binding transcriptional MerR regulator
MSSLSIREISRRTGIPESTLRYYRSLFPDCIPTIGVGRARRHPDDALPVFARIARLFNAGESRTAVRRELQLDGAATGDGAVADPDFVILEEAHERPRARYEIARAEPPGQLTSRDLEDMISAMLMRDRELAAMHRELLELVEQLIRTLGPLVGARSGAGPVGPPFGPLEPAIEPVRPADPAAEPSSTNDDLEVEQLRDRLARERETVERLRKARLELEQRVARLEREGRARK